MLSILPELKTAPELGVLLDLQEFPVCSTSTTGRCALNPFPDIDAVKVEVNLPLWVCKGIEDAAPPLVRVSQIFVGTCAAGLREVIEMFTEAKREWLCPLCGKDQVPANANRSLPSGSTYDWAFSVTAPNRWMFRRASPNVM